MTETIINGEIFSIILVGVVIFVLQKLISDIWITSNIEFQKCVGKIDALIIRYEFLCDYEYGSNSGANDEDVKFFRQELRSAVVDLVGKFRALFFIERWWFKYILRINIESTKPQLLLLSQVISTKKDVQNDGSRAREMISKIRKNLKLKDFKIDYSDL